MEPVQIVLDELIALRREAVSKLRLLPETQEKVVHDGKRKIDVCTYREESHSGRVIVTVKAFKGSGIIWAYADGFAINSDGELGELDKEERSTLY